MASGRSKIAPLLLNFSGRLLDKRRKNIGLRLYSWSRKNNVPELFSAMQIVENRMRQMDREMTRIFDELQNLSPVRLPRIFSPFDWGRSRDIPIIRTDGEDRTYRLEVDLQGLQPEDITITLKDNALIIQGKKEEVKEGSRYHREYSYQYSVPDEVNPDSVRSFFNNGVLTIEAPLPKLEESKPKEIPVQRETSSKKD